MFGIYQKLTHLLDFFYIAALHAAKLTIRIYFEGKNVFIVLRQFAKIIQKWKLNLIDYKNNAIIQ